MWNEPGIPSNSYNHGQPISIMVANMQRRYILRVPDNYDNTKSYKLIVARRQRDGNDVQMYANDDYHLLPLSGGNAIFVAPNGQKNGAPCTTTSNGDGSCGWPNPNGSDLALGRVAQPITQRPAGVGILRSVLSGAKLRWGLARVA